MNFAESSQPSISISVRQNATQDAPYVEKVQELPEDLAVDNPARPDTTIDLKAAQRDYAKRLKGKVPLNVTAVWEKGVVQCPELNLKSHLPRRLSYQTDAPACRSLHAPLTLAASSFAQKLVHELQQHEEVTLRSLLVTARSDVNLTALYQRIHDWDARDPYKTIDLEVQIDVDGMAQQELEEVAAGVMVSESPTMELLEEHFCVEVNLQVDQVEPTTKTVAIEQSCNVSEYQRIGDSIEGAMIQQLAVTCRLEENVLQVELDNGVTFSLSATETVAVGSTTHPTPVQSFFFDALALYMHTFVLRLATRGHALHSLTGRFSTVMNNGIKDYDDGLEPTVFSVLGGELELDVKSDADKTSVDVAFQETQDMAPSYLVASGKVEVELDITKVA